MPDEIQLPNKLPNLREVLVVIVALILLSLMGSFSLKVVHERDELKTENTTLRSQTHETVVKEPVYLAGKIVYRETLVKDSNTLATSALMDKVRDRQETSIKRGNAFLGVGLNTQLKKEMIGGADILGPLGLVAQTN